MIKQAARAIFFDSQPRQADLATALSKKNQSRTKHFSGRAI